MPISKLAKAIQLAASVHAEQVDKGGEPYILHPLAVMQMVDTGTLFGGHESDKETIMIVAVLHDVLEDFKGPPGDSSQLHEHILNEYGTRVYTALEALTKLKGETYEEYIEGVALKWVARKVKIADLTHNMDTGRLPEGDITETDFKRWDKYRRALVRLKRED